MKPRRLLVPARLFSLASFLMLLNGCATQALWEKSFNCPAPQPNLRLYAAPQPGEVLVAYDAVDEKRGTLHRRVYSLRENAGRIKAARRPQFLDLTVLNQCPPIPVFEIAPESDPKPPAGLYAVLRSNPSSFILCSSGQDPETHDLPTYAQKASLTAQILLTPVTVAVDLTVVGAVVAYYTAEMWGPSLSGKSL